MTADLLNHILETSPQKGTTRFVLAVLAWRADDDGASYPAISTIAKQVNVHERNIQRAISELIAAGELEMRVGAGPHGANVYRVISARGQQLVLVTGGGAGATGGGSATPAVAPPKTTVPLGQIPEDEVRGVLGGGNATPARVPPVATELKAQLKTARSEWLAVRKRRGIQRHTDPKALTNLEISVKRAILAEAWQDVLSAVREMAADPDSNPWYLDQKAREVGGLRREAERILQKHKEREQLDQTVDAEWARLRKKYPGKTAAEILVLEAKERVS